MQKEQRIIELEKLKKEATPYKYDNIIYKDINDLAPVYLIPLHFLVYNKYNGRILSMVKSFERQFRKLDPVHPEDKKIIELFLWESRPDRNRTTMQDLRDHKQKKVGIVTKDGIIIDGNRRASLLNKIAEEDNTGPAYFMAIILDDTLDGNPQEIMKLETTYQMGEDEKLDYNPIEKYLKCKDLIDAGFRAAQIAAFMNEKETQILEWLSIMNLMDNYLEALGYDSIYTRLDRLEGQFVDLNKYLKKYDNGAPAADWNYDQTDLSDLKAICFDYIRARYEGKEFRAIANPSKKESFFCKKKVWEKFRDEHFKTIETINKNELSIDELRKREPDGDLSEILRVRDEDWTNSTKALLTSNLNRSQRALEDVNEENEPVELLKRAKETLLSINPGSEGFYADLRVVALIREINKITEGFTENINRKKK